MKLSRRLFLLSPLALAYKPSWGALSFPLPQGNFVPPKMPMNPVYPRPDSETQPHARHRWAHPDFRYEIPIGVQGGAWPFKYEIVNSPSGATIGKYYGDPDYGVLKWTPANGDSGTKTFTIRVTDQELNTIDLTWKTTIDANKFVFLDANAVSTGSGTISDPLKSFSDWYKGDASDATYQNKIIVFRAGNYALAGDPDTTDSNKDGNAYMTPSKTPSLIGYPSELPVIDCSTGKFFFITGLPDIFVAGLTFENARSDVKNSHFFWLSGQDSRLTFWNNTFYNIGTGFEGSDNPSPLFFSNTEVLKHYYLVKGNTFDTVLTRGSNGSLSDMYVVSDVLIEENTVQNCDAEYGFWAKATHENVTIRANKILTNNTTGGITFGLWSPWGGTVHHNHEACWNVIKVTTGWTIRISQEEDLASTNNHVYRNTFIGGEVSIRFNPTEPYHLDANVAEITNPTILNGSNVSTTIPNLVGSLNAGLVDNNGILANQFRLDYLGQIGYEVSSSEPRQPKSPNKINFL